MSTHGALVNEVLLFLSQAGALAWANQTGQGWVGQYDGRDKLGRTVIRNALPVRFGLPGSTDVIAGLKQRMIVVEVKTGTGKLQKNQKNFRDAAHRVDVIHIEARSVDDVRNRLLLEGLIDG